MRTRILMQLTLVAVMLATVTSCKDTPGKSSAMRSPVSGAANELLLIMNKSLWKGSIGDTIRNYFEQPQLGLPQPEPIFNVLNLPLASFEKNLKSHRNVLIVDISSKIDSATFLFKESPWARSQKLFKISAPSDSAFYRLFNANKDRMMSTYLKAERERMVEVYKKTPDTKIFKLFKDKYNMLLYCPGGYKINKDTSDFVWISSETYVDSKGLVFFQENYTSESQFNYQIIMDRVNEELKKYIPASLPKSWMALDLNVPVTAATYNYDGVHYAVVIKGLWTAVNDFMAGPFVLNVVLDQQHNRVIYMMGYVYAPDGRKRNMLRQVESILYTMNIDYDKQPEAEEKPAEVQAEK